MYYDDLRYVRFDDARMDREIRRERRLEQRTEIITTDASWRACGSEAVIAVTTTAAIYESIRYTVGREIAENFLKCKYNFQKN